MLLPLPALLCLCQLPALPSPKQAPAKAQVPPAAPAAHSYYLEMSTESDGSGSNGPPPFTTMGRTLGTTCVSG